MGECECVLWAGSGTRHPDPVTQCPAAERIKSVSGAYGAECGPRPGWSDQVTWCQYSEVRGPDNNDDTSHTRLLCRWNQNEWYRLYYIYIDAVSSAAADTRVLASFPVPSTPGLISETASAPEVNPGLLDSFFYKDLEATDANAFPSSPVQVAERWLKLI